MAKYLVTGSAGFVGFHVVQKLLAANQEVIGVDNLNDYYTPKLKNDRNAILLRSKNYTFYKSDICNYPTLTKIFQKHAINKICHLAAQAGVRYSISHPFAYERSNVAGFLNILEAARTFRIKTVVYASSSSVYGKATLPKTGFREEMPVQQPVSLYGATKIADEVMAYSYHHLYGLRCTGLRLFTVYGPWGRPDMAYMKFADAIAHGKPIDLYNNGNMKRDFTYIDDAVSAIISSLQASLDFETINIGSSRTVNLITFVRLIEKELGKKAIIHPMSSQPGDLMYTRANISKAKKLLHYRPNTSIQQGIKLFVQWYKEYNRNSL